MRPLITAAAVAGAVLVVPVGAMAVPKASSPAATSSTIYVDNRGSCSATGGTAALPLCTIQQAADVVNAGQTVQIGAGIYAPFTLSRSGTAADPITFTAAPTIRPPQIGTSQSGTTSLAGVHDVTLSHLNFLLVGGVGLAIDASHNITMDKIVIANESSSYSPDDLDIVNGSYNITVSRSMVVRGGALVSGGSHDVIATTNRFSNALGAALQVSGGSANVAITSNTINGFCGVGVVVQAASATIENNVIYEPDTTQSCGSPAAAIEVSSDAASQVTSNYNAIRSTAPWTEYSWGGTAYATAAALNATTGQGAHDIDYTATTVTPNATTAVQLVDSADASARGELGLDLNGRPRVDDPLVANTGTGASAPDIGQLELQDPIAMTMTESPATGVVPVTATVTVSGLSSGWSESVSATVDFGDGSAPIPTSGGKITHTYTKPGAYTETTTATDAGGSTLVRTAPVVVATTTLPSPSLTVGPYTYDYPAGVPNIAGGSATFGISAAADPWELQTRVLDFGDGTSTRLLPTTPTTTWSHMYSSYGTYTATLTDVDVLGRATSASVMAVSADEYQPLGPIRDYDSRWTGKQIPGHSVVQLSLAQLNAPYSFVDAVQLNVTVTGAQQSGYVSVYPDGGTRPTVSTLNFAAGQTTANEVTATASTNGTVDFYNGGPGPIDLIIDTFGQDVRNVGADTYIADGPIRLLDTRNGTGAPNGKIPGGGSVTLTVAGTAGVPAKATAAVLNIATTGSTTSGYMTAYADGASWPGTSNSNWGGGTTVSNLAIVPMTDGKVVLYNGGKGAVDFVADLVGYYILGGMNATYLPHQPVRLLDTRTGVGVGGHIAKLAQGQTLKLQITGVAGMLPSGTTAASVNITATGASAGGYLTAYPDGITRPTASSVNYVANHSVANMSIMPVGTDGAIDIYNGGTEPVDIVVDLNGTYFEYPPR